VADTPASPRQSSPGKKMSRRELRKSLNLSSSCLTQGFHIPPAEGYTLPRDRKGKTEIHYEVEKVSTGKLVELLEKNPKEVRFVCVSPFLDAPTHRRFQRRSRRVAI
jgi:hypothetical protein